MISTVGEALRDAINEAGYEFRDYSGRGMYGARCLGVECDDVVKCVVEIVISLTDMFNLGSNDMDLFTRSCKVLRSGEIDSMGRGSILYFPSVPYGSANIDESDDEK